MNSQIVRTKIQENIAQTTGLAPDVIKTEHPELTEEHGDFCTSAALVSKGGKAMAEKIAEGLLKVPGVVKTEVAGPGFVNIWLADEVWLGDMADILKLKTKFGQGEKMTGKKLMVEYAHPNTHKEMHVGHMRTLITGEAVARILEKNGAKVFRANYQGDIGPHVAKAIWGTEKIITERNLSWEKAEEMNPYEKAHLLGEGYVRGNKDYETHKEDIDKLNKDLYEKKAHVMGNYEITRRWSLDYYKLFYDRFGTVFDRLFFESEVADKGKQLVISNVGRVFEKSEGAVIFDGEKYGLHKRVFLTNDGNPTYEGKEMALAYLQFGEFPFDRCIHVVANEQNGYFSVVIKALELLDPQFEGREYHLSMGMFNLVGRKMASRTGDILTVDGLIGEIKSLARELNKQTGVTAHEIEEISESVALAAIKYSVLKANPGINVAFDPKQSVSLEGNSGPYLLYAYARCKSVLAKAELAQTSEEISEQAWVVERLERQLMRWLARFPEVVEEAGERLSPNLVASYLHDLASMFNGFYNQHSILGADNEKVKEFRLRLTAATAQVIQNGLEVLGIKTLERM